jgi:two-component system aerobic respiration control sensor histidine kinase ArcB
MGQKEKNENLIFIENIVAEIPISVYWMNKDFVYLGCSSSMAELLNLSSRSDIVGKTYSDLFDEKSSAHYRKADTEVITKGVSLSLEEPLYAPDGSKKIYLSKKIPLHDQDGNIIGMLGVSVDITDRKKMEEDLRIAKDAAEAASRSKTAFIANISHDTRTPLTGVIGLSRALEEPVISDAERIEYAHMLHESGDKLLEFSESVLEDVAADAMTDEKVIHESFDVRKVIHDVVALERPTVELNHLTIQPHIDFSIPHYLIGDKMKIHRILLNLAGNAIKFTKVGGIELNARLCGIQNNKATIEFSVKDTGIGIAPEHQAKVFDQFYKVSPSYKGLYTGYGLGLHIVQKFASLMGGEIHLESELDVGSTISFVVTMDIGEKPAVDPNSKRGQPIGRRMDVPLEKTPKKVVAEVHQPIDSDKPQVLLVEDNATAMIVLKTLVQKFNVQITTAVDAERAFELVQSQLFDLVVTDLGLPGKQGDDLSRMIRAYEKENARQPMMIVGLTGHAVGEITTHCIDAGMNEVYQKPMTVQTATALIEQLMNKKNSSEITSPPSGGLGVDLPNTEAELFEIDHYPLFDINVGINVLGSEDIVREILKSLKVDAITDDLALIKKAHAAGDWVAVEKLAHKMKGGSDFGTVRMHYALLYMERYRKAGHTKYSEQLYQQMLKTIDETMDYLDDWLKA